MKKATSTEIEVVFSLNVPLCSKKKAKILIEEMIGTIHNELDNGENPMDSFSEFFGEDEDNDEGYSYGFDKKLKIKNI
jgi:hypothetical protein